MVDKKTPDEKDIIAGCIDGKSWAQRALYEQYAPAMMSVCVRYVTNHETARDLLQEGFIKIFTKISSYSGTGAFGGWVRRVFVTTALEYLRQNDALKQSIDIDDLNYQLEFDEVSVLEKISADDLLLCIAQLSDGYRTVFNMYAIEGYSHAEIAEFLGVSEVTSRTQYLRARKILQKTVITMYGNEKSK